jgi:soluble lytic murein transglycosylase-like protein
MLAIPHMDAPLYCINEAAIEFHIPAKLIIALLHTERGKNGEVQRNKNGTYDIGPMQINSSWLPELKRYGITRHDLQYNPCINVKVGAWIAAKFIAHENDLLTGIGDYNSHTKKFNQSYYQQVRIHFTQLTRIVN